MVDLTLRGVASYLLGSLEADLSPQTTFDRLRSCLLVGVRRPDQTGLVSIRGCSRLSGGAHCDLRSSVVAASSKFLGETRNDESCVSQ